MTSQPQENSIQDFKDSLVDCLASFDKLEHLSPLSAIEAGCDEFRQSLEALRSRFSSVETALLQRSSRQHPTEASERDEEKGPAEGAWDAVKAAAGERDLSGLKEAIKAYCRVAPETTYHELELSFRHNGFPVYLIASDKEVSEDFTLIDLQGIADRRYSVGYFFDPRPLRPSLQKGWPASPEENLERLENSGVPVDREYELVART